MANKKTSCGCNTAATLQVEPDYMSKCKTEKKAFVDYKDRCAILTLVSTKDKEPIVPTTSTKAVFDEKGNSLDSILKCFNDRLSEFDTTKILYTDCGGIDHEINVVLNKNISVVDNFNIDSGGKALSASKGKFLYDAVANSDDFEFKDNEEGLIVLSFKNLSGSFISNLTSQLTLLSNKLDSIESRISALETGVQTLPTNEDLSLLRNEISDIISITDDQSELVLTINPLTQSNSDEENDESIVI